MIAQIRSGILPLNIELGRFRNIDLENRLCLLCNNDCIEDEFHFVMQCEFHNNSRSIMFEKIISNFPAFSTLNQNEKFVYIMKYEWKFLGKYLKSAWENRKKKLYV